MTAIVFAAALSGCASAPATPTVYAYPAKGHTPQQQAQDSSQCQTWAQQQLGYTPSTDAAKGAGVGLAGGALGGAAAGGIGGAFYGGTSQYGKGQAGYDQGPRARA